MLSACSIFINNASLWKTLQATLLFYLMYVSVFIYRNDSLLMTIYKYEKIIRLDALSSMRDMSYARDPPPRGQHLAGRKIYIDPLFSENASKITTFFFKCHHLSDVTTQRQP